MEKRPGDTRDGEPSASVEAGAPRGLDRRPARHLAVLLGALVCAVSWAYVSAVFLLDEAGSPIPFGRSLWVATTLGGLVLALVAVGAAVKRAWLSQERVATVSVALGSLLVSLLVVDTVYTLYLNGLAPPDPDGLRVADEHAWIGELYPRSYFPTERSFELHKPGVRVTGTHFGNFYRTPMLESPTLVNQVLEARTVTIDIDSEGFRESSAMKDATVFTLGDSFTFGWGVDEEESWPGLLEGLSGQVVYNLGIHDASPRQELGVLDHVLRHREEAGGVRRVLWMIYEGNDLEDDPSLLRPPIQTDGRGRGTVLGLLANVPRALKDQAVITKIRTGEISLRRRTGLPEYDPHSVDGVSLSHPLYRSESLGWRLFHPSYVERATVGESYVRNHPNRPLLDDVFREMAGLAREFDVQVTVLLAPTAARLHGPHFQAFPVISERPYFLEYVGSVAGSVGFDVLDLHDFLVPDGGRELLFFRDDDHFNVRGHERVAQIVQQELFPLLEQAVGEDPPPGR